MVRKTDRRTIAWPRSNLFTEQGGGGAEAAAWISSRHSTSPKLLAPPGPADVELETMIRAAVSAPDHGRLRPWRFIRIADAGRDALGELFAEAKRRKDPDCSVADLERERDRAARAPGLVAVVARIDGNCDIPVHEQFISVGAAVQNLLLVAHAFGYGARLVSGAKTRDRQLCAALGLKYTEDLVGFICIGTPARPAKCHDRPDPTDHLSVWPGPSQH